MRKLEELLPHGAPMIVLSGVKNCDIENSNIETFFTVSPSDIFFDENFGGVPSHFALEYMAQSIACFVGILGKAQNPQFKQEMGFVLGTRKMVLNIPAFENSKTYGVKAEKVFFDEEMASFECAIFDENGFECASATVNAFKPKNPLKFLNENNE